MIDRAKWQPLWDKAPDLAIPGLEHEPATEGRMAFWTLAIGGAALTGAGADHLRAILPDAAVELMVQATAVWWLGTKNPARPAGVRVGPEACDDGTDDWYIEFPGDGPDDQTIILSNALDRTEALRLACCAVLEIEP